MRISAWFTAHGWHRLLSTGGVAVAVAVVVVVGATGCGGSGGGPSGGGSEQTLTIYDGQHESTGEALVKAFEAKTGIDVTERSGESDELANQIVEEGAASPADIFYSEETAPMLLLAEKKRLATLPESALAPIPAGYRSPAGRWTGVSARARVVAYNPARLGPKTMPASVLNFADPRWKGRIGIVPTSGSFQEQIEAVVTLKGRAAALQWLRGLKANAEIYKSNTDALDAVNQGQVDLALINHYYWFREVAEKGAGKVSSRLFYFENGGPGSLVNVSPIGVLESSKHQQAAAKFVAFATSKQGQQVIAKASAEYPLTAAVSTSYHLEPFEQLDPPKISPAQLGDGRKAVALLQDVGLL